MLDAFQRHERVVTVLVQLVNMTHADWKLMSVSVSDDNHAKAAPLHGSPCQLVRRHLREGIWPPPGPGRIVATDGQIGHLLRGPETASNLLVRPHRQLSALRGNLVSHFPTSLQDRTARSHAL